MKALHTFAVTAAAAAVLAGCNAGKEAEAPPASPPAPTAPAAQPVVSTGKPLGSVKVGDQAVCAICATNSGAAVDEEVKATLDYKGKTYAFCSESEKAEFISNPAKYTGGQ